MVLAGVGEVFVGGGREEVGRVLEVGHPLLNVEMTHIHWLNSNCSFVLIFSIRIYSLISTNLNAT